MLPLVVAEFSPLSPGAQLAIASVLSIAGTCAVIWGVFRRKPPVGEDLVQLRASIDALNKSVESLTKAHEKHATHATEIEALQEKVRTLERLREEDIQNSAVAIDDVANRVMDRLNQFERTTALNFQAVERAIGKLEGKVDMITR